MDLRSGQTYKSKEAAVAAGVPEKRREYMKRWYDAQREAGTR